MSRWALLGVPAQTAVQEKQAFIAVGSAREITRRATGSRSEVNRHSRPRTDATTHRDIHAIEDACQQTILF
jgi:hypothetical protein